MAIDFEYMMSETFCSDESADDDLDYRMWEELENTTKNLLLLANIVATSWAEFVDEMDEEALNIDPHPSINDILQLMRFMRGV